MDHYKLFINGQFVDSASGKTFEVIDPGSETPIATVAQAGAAEAEQAIAAARKAFDKGGWSDLTPAARMAKLQDFADQVDLQGLRLATTESMNAGQIVAFSKLSAMGMVGFLRNISMMAATQFPWEEDVMISGNSFGAGRELIRREPIGVCVGIVPWNFPMNMAFWKIGPALIMGNTVVLKPASLTPLSALIIAEAAKAAGLPDGVINVIAGPGGELGKVLCTHPDVDKIAFTGSTEVGREIMRMASSTVKKVTLELGGKSANIILDDADMDLAVEGACFGTFLHQGQMCESGTRVLVSSKIYDEFLDKMKKRAEAIRVGHQLDPNSHMGPLASKEQLATVEKYVKLGQEEGAQIITGGKRVQVPGIPGGYYYAPTIFANVKNSMRIAQEEIFGPVVCVIKFNSDDEAIAIANDSIYGLGGAVFSRNTARAEHIAHGVRTGTMWINNYHWFSDFCPFGGYKQSGVGRELGLPGLHEYVQVKRVHVSAMGNPTAAGMFSLMQADKHPTGFAYCGPTNVVAGHGALSSAYKSVVDLGCSKAMIITDDGVRKAGLAQMVKDTLAGFCVGIYDKIPADPDIDSVDAAVEAARDLKADCIVSVGGGSVIDSSKGVCVTLKMGGKVNDHCRQMVLREPVTPHICIPTTSGTGSEVTIAAVLTNKGAGRKVFMADQMIVPNVALLDPRMTVSLPKGLTAATAMDALTHAVEAMTSLMNNPICDGLALHAIRLISDNLPAVIADGKNEKARLNMQIAATMAGWAFSVAQTGLAHGMAHTVGTLYHVPHGLGCGIMIPKVMRYNVDHSTDQLARIAQAMGINTTGMNNRDAALAAADAVEALMKKVGHPMGLREVGVPGDNFEMCALHAISDMCVIFNGRPVTDLNDIVKIYQEAY